jgi:hypothetical protein
MNYLLHVKPVNLFVSFLQSFIWLHNAGSQILDSAQEKVFILSVEHATPSYRPCHDGAICFYSAGREWREEWFCSDNFIVIVGCYDNSF